MKSPKKISSGKSEENYEPQYCEDCGCFIEQGKTKCNKCYLKEGASHPKDKKKVMRRTHNI
ncbi:MAG: hypothetical protein NT076_03785 [Candidatus Pacearchaeota archaeon]|nr:hypothetical protein [Candidatus Pacearchaeota archaeon]